MEHPPMRHPRMVEATVEATVEASTRCWDCEPQARAGMSCFVTRIGFIQVKTLYFSMEWLVFYLHSIRVEV